MANCSQEEKWQRARALLRQREAIEEEIKSISSMLTGPGGPGLHGNLVDSEGFPRNDLDIISVRSQRQRIAHLYTDHKSITDELEQLLHSILGRGSESISVTRSSLSEKEPLTLNSTHLQVSDPDSVVLAPLGKPFALVDRIVTASPADLAGMKDGDRIIAFANISTETKGSEIEAYRSLAPTVRDFSHVSVPVAVERVDPETHQTLIVHLDITPLPWDGPGLLGCSIL
ncbi:26S proteasome non-ATPase regulatory subunit 9 [Galdieria sulphuraria]|nr:26S proteasome non-ATPase regulatory subunit 9 [Galdieria sulphuraria]